MRSCRSSEAILISCWSRWLIYLHVIKSARHDGCRRPRASRTSIAAQWPRSLSGISSIAIKTRPSWKGVQSPRTVGRGHSQFAGLTRQRRSRTAAEYIVNGHCRRRHAYGLTYLEVASNSRLLSGSGRRRSRSPSGAGRPEAFLAGEATAGGARGPVGRDASGACDVEGTLGAGDGEGALAGPACCKAVVVDGV